MVRSIFLLGMILITLFGRSLAGSLIRSSLHSQQLRAQPDRGQPGRRGAGQDGGPAAGLLHRHAGEGREPLTTWDRSEDLCGGAGEVTNGEISTDICTVLLGLKDIIIHISDAL